MASTITKFSPAVCKTVADRITAALAPLAKELGVTIRAVGGSYGPGHYTCKVEIATVGEDGAVHTRAADTFRASAKFFGLEPTDLGRTFRSGGRTFTVSGLSPRGRKRPILAKTDDGKEYCFTPEDVQRALAYEDVQSAKDKAHG